MPENLVVKKVGSFIREHPRLERFLDFMLRPVEVFTKKPVFGCQMCGQCVLHSTGMVCPMNCPKNIRNGPCGGVRLDGACEVYPLKDCVWTKAYVHSQRFLWPREIHDLRPPVDWSLQGSSSWVNYLTERDHVTSGCYSGNVSALDLVDKNGK